MAKKYSAAFAAAAFRVNYLVALCVAVVFNFTLASCDGAEDDLYDTKVVTTQSEARTAKPQPIQVPGLEFTLEHDSLYYGNGYSSWWTTSEKVTGTVSKSELNVKASHAFDGNAVLDKNKVIDLSYAQSHTTYSEVKSEQVANNYYEKRMRYSQRATALLGDEGTQCYLDGDAVIAQANLRDTLHYMAADSIIFGNAKVKALRFIDKAVTRAAEYYVDKNNPFFVEVTWTVPVQTVHLANNYRYNVEVKDTIMDYPLVKNDITKVDVDTSRVAVDDTWERCSLHFVYHHKNGETDEAQKNILLNREIITIPEYTKEVSNFEYRHSYDNALKIGSSYTPANMQQDNCTFSERVDEFNGVKSDGISGEQIETDYKYRHQAVRYKDEWVDILFDFVKPAMGEKATRVEGIVSDDIKYDMARLFNTINTSYLGYYQEAGETVKLIKKAEGIKWEGFESLDGTRTVYNDSIAWTPVYRTEYRDGSVVRTSARNSDLRLHEILSNWTSIEENESQTTGNLSLGDASYRTMTREINGFRFEWERETREGSSIAKLNGSTQDNKGRFIEPVHVKVTHIASGNSITYTDLNVSTSNTASVTGGAEKDGYKVYDYRDNWNYRLGGNTINLVAPGTIKVKVAPVEPKITFKGFTTVTITVTDSLIKRHAVHTKEWDNGKKETKTFDLVTDWNAYPTTLWESIEANNTQSTSNAVLSVTSRNTQTREVNGATFKFTRVNATAGSNAKLNASTQRNGWALYYEEGSSSISYDGDEASFDNLVFNISNSAQVGNGTVKNGYTEYKYTDKLTTSLNGRTKYSPANGTIKVKVADPEVPTFFPKEWGKLVATAEIVSNNEAHNGWVYTWSLRFDKGYVLPVVIRPGSTTPEWNFDFVEKTAITTFNGGTYDAVTKKWLNCTAKDQTNHMVWARSGIERANKSYSIARSENWDEGRLVNGKPSVTTKRYTLTIKNGVLTAVDTYTGKTMGSWTSYTK